MKTPLNEIIKYWTGFNKHINIMGNGLNQLYIKILFLMKYSRERFIDRFLFDY